MTGPLSGETRQAVSDAVLLSGEAPVSNDTTDIEAGNQPMASTEPSTPQPMVEDSLLIDDLIEESKWKLSEDFDSAREDGDAAVLITDETDYEQIIDEHRWNFESKAFERYYQRKLK
jgi:hypothetical protein